MKKLIITLVVLIGSAALIAMVLTNNKKENEAKIEIINQGDGKAAVKVTSVSLQDMDLSYSVNGNFAPIRELEMKSENPGIVVSISVNEGDYIREGQVLVVVDDKYLSLQQESAEEAYQKLLTDKERYESSFETGGVTRAQLDEIELQLRNAKIRLEEAKRRRGDANIKAPISGIINKKHIEKGAYLGPGSPLFDIVDVSSLKLKVSVDENHVVQFKKGDPVDIRVPVFPGKTFSGRISFIAPKADQSLNFPVEIRVNNDKESRVKAGMYATAIFSADEIKNALFVPRSAFVGSVQNQEVYVLQPDQTVSLRNVIPGMIVGERVEILDGLEEGEQIVVTGQINLYDGAAVEVLQ